MGMRNLFSFFFFGFQRFLDVVFLYLDFKCLIFPDISTFSYRLYMYITKCAERMNLGILFNINRIRIRITSVEYLLCTEIEYMNISTLYIACAKSELLIILCTEFELLNPTVLYFCVQNISGQFLLAFFYILRNNIKHVFLLSHDVSYQ